MRPPGKQDSGFDLRLATLPFDKVSTVASSYLKMKLSSYLARICSSLLNYFLVCLNKNEIETGLEAQIMSRKI